MKNIDKIINERLDLFIENNELNEVVSLSAAFTTAMLTQMIVGLYTSHLSKMARSCRNYEGSAKTVCNLNFRIQGLNIAINKAKQVRTKCKDTRNEVKCLEKINNKINNMQERIKAYTQQLNELKSYSLK